MIKSKRRPDANELAASIVKAVTEEKETDPLREKNPAAVALGRLGGKAGGPARAKSLSAKKRSDIAKKGAAARWKKK